MTEVNRYIQQFIQISSLLQNSDMHSYIGYKIENQFNLIFLITLQLPPGNVYTNVRFFMTAKNAWSIGRF